MVGEMKKSAEFYGSWVRPRPSATVSKEIRVAVYFYLFVRN